MRDATQRFSTRVENYVRYRPSYPPGIIDFLAGVCGLTSTSIIADVGSGTGLLAELFLKNGNPLFGVEPNAEMRAAGERLLEPYANFTSVDGAAEATTLPAESVDIITAGQAFHWFDRQRSQAEFARILRPGGWVVLIWNERRVNSTPFLQAYEQLLRAYSPEYETLNHREVDLAALADFFGRGGFRRHSFENQQVFDYEGVRGRLLSSSYTPEATDPGYDAMLEALWKAFEMHQLEGKVIFEYETHIYYGQFIT